MNTGSHLPPLSVGKYLTDITTPFESDLLDRKKLADKLTGYIDRLSAGAVIAIDAPWGEGKTWFGKNWARQLESDHRVLYLDAFEGDYMDDPFLLVSAEITRLQEKDEQSDFKQKTARAMKLLLPIGKTVINVAAQHLTGIPDISGKWADLAGALHTTVSDSAEKLIQAKIDEYITEQSSLKVFRDRLAEIAASEEKPIVFFIDELDRCSPAFAVALLERLKHFFEVPNLVFVLLIHRNQLHEAIRGVYGQNTDAAAYLHKFVHLFLTLPVRRTTPKKELHLMQNFISNSLKRHKLNNEAAIHHLFTEQFSLWSYAASLSLRDMEKGIALYLLTTQINIFKLNLLCFLIVLKLQKPEWLNRLISRDDTLYEEINATYFLTTKYSRPVHEEVRTLFDKTIMLIHKTLIEKDIEAFECVKYFINELDLSIEE